MKVFEKDYGPFYECKINFVDDNNVVVGFDTGSCCCERFGWFIAPVAVRTKAEFDKMYNWTEDEAALRGYNFDPYWYVTVEEFEDDDPSWGVFDAGAMAIFRMVKGDKEKFLHLFNCHNGYYGHGFTMRVGDEDPRFIGSL